MRIVLAAVGRFKPGPERALYEEYTKRLPWKVSLQELDARQSSRENDTPKLLAACDGMRHIVALDEQGGMWDSVEFARRMDGWARDGGAAFIIGGADGLDRAKLKGVQLLSFGRATWPHMLVRAMLAEQLYRAYTILQNHPYHRV